MARDIQAVAPSPIFAPGVVAHKRVTVTNTATALDALITIPTIDSTVRPTGVYLAVESGQTNTVYFTFDGSSTPAATLGFTLPLQPAPPVYVPCQASGYPNGMIKLVAPSGNTYVQAKFEWTSSVG